MTTLLESLKQTFGGCKRIDTSKCLNKSSFETTSLGFFFVVDDTPGEPVRVVGPKENYQLRVQNSDNKIICLIKTDNCLFDSSTKKCDCILLSKDSCFLVEISESSTGQRHRKRTEAIDQLEETIQLFKDKNIDLATYNSKAVICFKNGKTRPIQTSFTTKQAIFLNDYKISLEEGNFISF